LNKCPDREKKLKNYVHRKSVVGLPLEVKKVEEDPKS
jgi:hypothetical protein